MAQQTLLRNARVIDCISKQPRDGVSILIRGERIVKVDARIDAGADTDVIDCTGKTLMPGLIDTHVHATMVDEIDLQLFLGAGVTTARDVGGKLEKVIALRGRVNSGAVLGPRLFVCGPLLDGRGDSFDHQGEFGIMLDNVPDVAAAPGKINQLLSAGVDGIKLYLTNGAWLLVRSSGTEPLLRVYTEAESPETVQEVLSRAEDFIRGL